MYRGTAPTEADRLVLEKAADLYARITGRKMPEYHFQIINARTQEHALSLCNSIAAKRRRVMSYHPD